MLAFLVTAIVDTAACHDRHITVFSDIKIVINQIRQSRLRQYHGNMNTFLFRSRLDNNVNSGFIRLGDNINVFRRLPGIQFAVCPNIICTGRHFMQT